MTLWCVIVACELRDVMRAGVRFSSSSSTGLLGVIATVSLKHKHAQ